MSKITKRKRIQEGYKIVVTVDTRNKKIQTISVFDNRTGENWTDDMITERNIWNFSDLEDLELTLNWNLGGDSRKYLFKWTSPHTGAAYIYD